jgi:hypothetical protein
MRLTFDSSSASVGGGRSAAGKGCLTVFFAVFLIAGLVATAAVLVEAARETAVWFWPERPCTVVDAGVEKTGEDVDPYRASVLFEYEVDGRAYRSSRVHRGSSATSSYDEARGPSDRHPRGSTATCRVHPDRPDEAVLEPRLPTVAFVSLFTLIFVAVGAGGIIFIWKGVPAFPGAGGGESISQRARGVKDLGRKIGLAVGLVFVVVGGGLSVFLLAIPAARLALAATWVETPAVVVGSTIRSWSTDDGTTYRADILYEYEADGRLWRSNRRTFFPLASSGYDDQKAVTDRFPVGAAVSCFVHPADPSRSVLDRRPRPVYLIGLFPLVFLLVGLAVTAGALRSGRTSASAVSSSAPGSASGLEDRSRLEAEVDTGQRVLEPDAGPIAKVVGMTIVAAIWNGIISVFLWQVYRGFATGNPEWFLTIFMIPFVLVGLGLVIGIFHTALAAFNPRPRLTISPASPRLGTRLQVGWAFTGSAGRISRLEIALEGHESATYRRGTDSHTDRTAFASFDLVSTGHDWEIARGSAEVGIPEDTMHSFSSSNNAVVWSLVVRGDIRRWPDVSETFEIEIRPLARDRLLP